MYVCAWRNLQVIVLEKKTFDFVLRKKCGIKKLNAEVPVQPESGVNLNSIFILFDFLISFMQQLGTWLGEGSPQIPKRSFLLKIFLTPPIIAVQYKQHGGYFCIFFLETTRYIEEFMSHGVDATPNHHSQICYGLYVQIITRKIIRFIKTTLK